MEDILKVLVESRKQPGTSQQSDDPMTSLVGSLLGGGQPQSQSHAPINPNTGTGGTDLSGMMGMLEMFMGNQGGTSSAASSDPIMALLTPFVAPLAKKANIPPEIAMIVITFVVHKLLAHHPTSGRDSNTFDFDNMLGQMSTGKVDSNLLQQSGMVGELSKKTGMDEAATEQALQLAFSVVGKTVSKMANKPSKPKTAGAAPKGKSAKSAAKKPGASGARGSKLKRTR
jgi:hypothetical protein